MMYNQNINQTDLFIDFDYNGQISLKDFSVNAIKQKVEGIELLIDPMVDLIPKKKYVLVDFFAKDYKAGSCTCVDTGWHLDGKLNPEDREQYVIWSKGDFRTQFATQFSNDLVPSQDTRKEDFENIILSSDFSIFEVKNCKPIVYDSFCFHKGRVVKYNSRRLFCRVMTSNHIFPKNKVLF